MPNQSVRCPSCGSSQCQEYRADAFVCASCNSTFRWVNPMKMTVQQLPAACACGKLAKAVCTQCRTSVCKSHQASWQSLFAGWQDLKVAYAGRTPELLPCVRKQGGMANFLAQRPPGWLAESGIGDLLIRICQGKVPIYGLSKDVIVPVLASVRLGTPQMDESTILCLACIESLFVRLLRPVELQIQRLEAAGRLCSVCTKERNDQNTLTKVMAMGASFHCPTCGMGLCGAHAKWREHCIRGWCPEHWNGSAPKTCENCGPPKPRGLLRRLFS